MLLQVQFYFCCAVIWMAIVQCLWHADKKLHARVPKVRHLQYVLRFQREKFSKGNAKGRRIPKFPHNFSSGVCELNLPGSQHITGMLYPCPWKPQRDGCLIFTAGVLHTHLFVELYAQTRSQSHSCSLSTSVMRHNAVVGFAQRRKHPERPWQLEPDLSFNNDTDQVIFCVTWPNTEHTRVVTYTTVYTQTSLIWWSPKSQVLTHTAVHFGYFRCSTVREEEREYHFSIPCLNSAFTQTIFVWHTN